MRRGGGDTEDELQGLSRAVDGFARDRRPADVVEASLALIPRLEREAPHDRWSLVAALDRLSAALSDLGRFDEMTEVQQRAIRVAEGAGPRPGRVAELRLALGDRLRDNARFDEAIRAYASAAERAELEFGSDHALAIEAGIGMAEAAAELGRHGDALRSYRWVVPSARRALGEDAALTLRAEAGRRASSAVRLRRIGSVVGAVLIAGIVVAVLWEQLG